MRYMSVCSGIEAASVAWDPLGWKAAALSDIEAFPRAVLRHHYPDVPLHGRDQRRGETFEAYAAECGFQTIGADEYGPIDLLVGGTPCQSFSLAGKRGGMADGRGNLALEYIRLAHRKRARWVVWENVPGVFSSNGGEDFRCFLSGLVRWNIPLPEGGWQNSGIITAGPADGAYGVAWAVRDAQYFGVAQRRRRVFVVGYVGDWRRAAAVLLERHSLQGHPAPRREKGPSVAALTANGVGTCGADDNQGQAGHLIASTGNVAHCLNAGGMGRQDYETETFIAFNITPSNSNKDFNAREANYAQALTAGGNRPSARGGDLIAFSAKDHGADAMDDCSPTLRAGGHSGSHANAGVMPAVAYREIAGSLTANYGRQPDNSDTSLGPNLAGNGSAVRRLTPRECERLQGFPDDYTLVPYRNGMAADGPRYKALGNSMAVPVMAWIGRRIQMVEDLLAQEMAA